MPTSTVEDYLKTIWLEEQRRPGQSVTTGQIAQALSVTPGTATSMMKALSDSGLVAYEPYAGVRLTPAGEQLAMHVLRRHRLVELFLVEVMGMSWSEVHGDAEILEHAVSDRLIERMDEMLGRPSTDPHGDPIPNARGELAPGREQHLLTECALGESVAIARVTDQRTEFLRMMESHGVMPGRRVHVAVRDPVADVVEIVPARGESLRLSFRAASRILVERPSREGAEAS